MSIRFPIVTALIASIAACAGGPALEYGVPTPADVRYAYADTTIVGVSAMGQSMEISQRAQAEYAVSFSPAPAGVNVTMTVSSLSGTISQPMGEMVRIREGDVQGALVFSLDRQGNAVITETPEVALEASQVISGLGLAHGFFPGLPARSVSVGDAWVDTLSFEGSEGAGRRSDSSVMQYAVTGDTVVAGRTLLVISMEGSGESFAEVSVSGMTVRQNSETRTEGHVLWDARAGLMVERHTVTTGEGTAAAPIVPTPFPIRVRARQHVRLLGM